MVVNKFILELVTLAALVAYLVLRSCRRSRERVRKEQELARISGYARRGFDVTGIRPRLDQVRADYTAELHRAGVLVYYRRQLLAQARAALAHLAFFRHAL